MLVTVGGSGLRKSRGKVCSPKDEETLIALKQMADYMEDCLGDA